MPQVDTPECCSLNQTNRRLQEAVTTVNVPLWALEARFPCRFLMWHPSSVPEHRPASKLQPASVPKLSLVVMLALALVDF